MSCLRCYTYHELSKGCKATRVASYSFQSPQGIRFRLWDAKEHALQNQAKELMDLHSVCATSPLQDSAKPRGMICKRKRKTTPAHAPNEALSKTCSSQGHLPFEWASQISLYEIRPLMLSPQKSGPFYFHHNEPRRAKKKMEILSSDRSCRGTITWPPMRRPDPFFPSSLLPCSLTGDQSLRLSPRRCHARPVAEPRWCGSGVRRWGNRRCAWRWIRDGGAPQLS
jgi:hypothetical protein